MGQIVEAERLAADVLKANRNDVGAASILARALMIQNRNEEAIAPLKSEPPAASRIPASRPCSARRLAAPVAAARQIDVLAREPPRGGPPYSALISGAGRGQIARGRPDRRGG